MVIYELLSKIKKTTTPFSGNFVDSTGNVRNIDGQLTTQHGIDISNNVFNGDYYDHEGKIRNLKELLDSFRSSGGGGSLPIGGTTGQVLTKSSNADGDATWATPSASSSRNVAVITQANYNSLSQTEKNNPNNFYLISDAIDGYVLSDQGAVNEGKVLAINSSGVVEPTDFTGIRTYKQTLTGDGIISSFDVVHFFNTEFTFIKVVDDTTSYQVEPSVIDYGGVTSIEVTFSSPIPSGQTYTVYVMAPA